MSLNNWNNRRTNDFKFIDKIISEYFRRGGVCMYIHKFVGVHEDKTTKESRTFSVNDNTIDDILFLENRSRKYDDNIYEMRAHYNIQNSEFDLTQFGVFLSSDTIHVTVHINDSVDKIGRRLISGDVIEFPHLRDDLIGENNAAINRFYVIEDVNIFAEGYDARWRPHILKLKAKKLEYTEAYRDIFENYRDEYANESEAKNIICDMASYNNKLDVNTGVEEEASVHVKYDSKYYSSAHLWVDFDEGGKPILYWNSSSTIPPNGAQLYGEGDSFTEDIPDGAYFLRTDYTPNRLFMRNGNKFIKIGDDLRKEYYPGTKTLSTFINNKTEFEDESGEVQAEKQFVSKVVKPKADMD